MERTAPEKIGWKNWTLIWVLGMAGQICWNIENSWFNNFVYDKIAPNPSIVAWMVGVSATVTTISTFLIGTLSDRKGKRRPFIGIGYILWGLSTIVFGLGEYLPKNPLILAAAYRAFRLPFFAVSLPAPLKKWWDFLTAPRGGLAGCERDRYIYLLCWTFIPFLFFSLPAIKEVTYLLPSYAGLAVLAAEYLERFIDGEDFSLRRFFLLFCLPCFLLAAAAEFLAPFSLPVFFAAVGVLAAAMAVLAVRFIQARAFRAVGFLILAVLVGGVVIGNVPELMRRTRLHRKCYRGFSLRVGGIAGTRQIHLHGGDESIRGSLPFFGDRPVKMLSKEELFKFMETPGLDRIVLMTSGRRKRLVREEETFRRLVLRWKETPFDLPDKADSFVMYSCREEAK